MKLLAFVLLIIGTFGLLLNELLLDLGSVFTVVLAALNLTGLAILAFSYWLVRD